MKNVTEYNNLKSLTVSEQIQAVSYGSFLKQNLTKDQMIEKLQEAFIRTARAMDASRERSLSAILDSMEKSYIKSITLPL